MGSWERKAEKEGTCIWASEPGIALRCAGKAEGRWGG